MTAKPFLRRVLALATLSASLLAGAAEWPSQAIKLVVPYPPGGAADTVARIYADALTASLGQPVLIDNRPGAGTALAAEFVANSPADGYTLALVPTGQLTVLPHIVAKLKFDPETSFAPISLLAYTGLVIAANDSVPVSNLTELVSLAKSKPGALSYSSSGSGTIVHLAGEYLRLSTGTDLLHVPFKGSAPAVTAVLGGNVDLAVDTLTILAPQIQAGKLKGLAIASKERSPLLPDVPTVAEQGYPDFVVTSWFGLSAPAATPAAVVSTLNQAVANAAADKSVQDKLAAQGLVAWPSTAEAFRAQVRSDSAKYADVVRQSHITFD
jgi:tripartite-type tricarboxylate transporter receptor subunit TctC